MNRRSFIRESLLASTLLPLASNSVLSSETAISHIEKLTILHTNDTHSRIEPFSSGRYKGLGGINSRQRIIKQIRSIEKNVLLLDSGDIFQGTPYFNLFHGELEFKAMSMMNYDASTMGNHDFDSGLENFNKQLIHTNFPFITSNYDFSNTILHNKTRDYIIIKKGDLKIGILGLGIKLHGLVPDKLYGETIYNNPISVGNKIAKRLKHDYKCDIIIALSHLGFKYSDKNLISDIILAEKTNNIDIILGGHTHTFLDCPIEVKNLSEKNVIINQVGWGGITLGKLDIYFNKENKSISSKSSNLLKCHNDI